MLAQAVCPCRAGSVLRERIEAKYGKTYDLSIVRREIPGKTLVALNVMWTHLAQQSFPMSEEEYMDKLDTLALYLKCAQVRYLLPLQSLPASAHGVAWSSPHMHSSKSNTAWHSCLEEVLH
jgi:hypothetical protein